MAEKLYPFSTAKHAHDIEYRYNRVKNEMHDFEMEQSNISYEEYLKLCRLEKELAELLIAVTWGAPDGRVCYLTGKQIALAKETVLWAEERRSRR